MYFNSFCGRQKEGLINDYTAYETTHCWCDEFKGETTVKEGVCRWKPGIHLHFRGRLATIPEYQERQSMAFDSTITSELENMQKNLERQTKYEKY